MKQLCYGAWSLSGQTVHPSASSSCTATHSTSLVHASEFSQTMSPVACTAGTGRSQWLEWQQQQYLSQPLDAASRSEVASSSWTSLSCATMNWPTRKSLLRLQMLKANHLASPAASSSKVTIHMIHARPPKARVPMLARRTLEVESPTPFCTTLMLELVASRCTWPKVAEIRLVFHQHQSQTCAQTWLSQRCLRTQ